MRPRHRFDRWQCERCGESMVAQLRAEHADECLMVATLHGTADEVEDWLAETTPP